jgi:hypothetical protein
MAAKRSERKPKLQSRRMDYKVAAVPKAKRPRSAVLAEGRAFLTHQKCWVEFAVFEVDIGTLE